MQEIIVPELLAGFFITVSLLRPFIQKLWDQEGLIWLPILAMGITIAIFPAYGFRPECIPLLIYGFFCVLHNLSPFIAFLSHSRDHDFRGRSRLPQTILLILLVPVLGIALFFAPTLDSALLEAGVTTAALTDESRGEELFLRIYGPFDDGEEPGIPNRQARRPLLVLIPPVSGSVRVIDRVCGELRDAGFTVATYSRRGFDSPAMGPGGKVYGLSPRKRLQLFRAERRGRVTVAANTVGRSLEEGRRQDIVFLLGLLGQNKPLPVSGAYNAAITAALAETDLSAVFLAGYDTGGSALLGLRGLKARYPAVKGVIAVESPLFSALTGEEPPPAPPPGDRWFTAVWSGIRSRFAALRTRKITGIGELPHPDVPVCVILSGNVENPRLREDRYTAILGALRNTTAPAILIAAAGAGPLDYSDIPGKYPIYSLLRSGGKKTLQTGVSGTHGPRETAALMINFAAVILEEEGRTAPVLSRRLLSSRSFYIETNSRWNSLKNELIL
jgi:hypothetical protein